MPAVDKHDPEPWSQDREDPRVVQNRKGEIAALAISEANALRIIASVNAVQSVSSESLDAGIVTEGLLCLSLLCRYHSDEKYKSEIDGQKGFGKLVARGNAVWGILKKEALAENWI
jgi:hypothetical protein